MDDPTLIAAYLAGESPAVAAVRAWIRSGLRGYRGRLGADVEDVEQEVLLDLLEALRAGKFAGASRFQTYVLTFTHHKCIDRLRSLARRTWVDLEEAEPHLRTAPRRDEGEDRRLALRVLEEAPEHCRELWRMVLAGLSYREMSERTGTPEGALRVQVLRCRKRARELRALAELPPGRRERES